MGPLREACDRCHAVKTRCSKPSSNSQCERCGRLGVPCTYSTADRNGRPQLRSRARQNSKSNAANPPNECTHGVVNNAQFTPLPGCNDTTASVIFNPDEQQPYSWTSMHDLMSLPRDDHDEDLCNISPSSQDLDSFFADTPATASGLSGGGGSGSNSTWSSRITAVAADAQSSPACTDNDTLQSLIQGQSRLTRAMQFMHDGGDVFSQVEELYQLAEELTSITEAQQGLLGEPHDSSSSNIPKLLLCGCYMTLLHGYSTLIAHLRREIQLGGGRNGRQPDGTMEAGPSSPVPPIGIGGTCLLLDRHAGLDIHLCLALYTLRQLRRRLRHCMPSDMMRGTLPPCDSATQQPRRQNSWGIDRASNHHGDGKQATANSRLETGLFTSC